MSRFHWKGDTSRLGIVGVAVRVVCGVHRGRLTSAGDGGGEGGDGGGGGGTVSVRGALDHELRCFVL